MGFGDGQNPESVDILEDLVIEFITEMTHKAMSSISLVYLAFPNRTPGSPQLSSLK